MELYLQFHVRHLVAKFLYGALEHWETSTCMHYLNLTSQLV